MPVKVILMVLENRLYYDKVPILDYKIQYPHFFSHKYQRNLTKINNYYSSEAIKIQRECTYNYFETGVENYKYSIQSKNPYRMSKVFYIPTIAYNKNCAISLYYDNYISLGGSHGITIRNSDTWDIQNGEFIQLCQLFENGVDEISLIRKSIENKLAFVSEDRRGVGLLLDTSIEMNIVMTSMQIKDGFLKPLLGIKAFKMMDEKKIRKHANKYIKELDIRCTGPTQYTRRLSGGNQQKVALCRLLHHDVDVFLLDEPTRGIDVGSKVEIYRQIGEVAAQGKAVLFVSSYLPELFGVCDRIGVMCRGELREVREVQDWDETSIMTVATGQEKRS